MTQITWHCEKCGSLGSSENRMGAVGRLAGQVARMLHDAVSPDCHPEQADISVRITMKEPSR